VLRDTVDQLDREVREKVDMLSEAQTLARGQAHAHWQGQGQGQGQRSALDVSGLDDSFNASYNGGGGGGGASSYAGRSSAPHKQQQYAESGAGPTAASAADGADLEALQRQVLRYKARAAAMDQLASMYRTSVLALYADGASYGAAQFGWQPHGVPVEFQANKGNGLHLIGVGWIEREMNAVKHSYEDEVRLLDAEVGELRSKLRESSSYIVELRKRFEENMRAIYRYV
jgi:hypothetical protein